MAEEETERKEEPEAQVEAPHQTQAESARKPGKNRGGGAISKTVVKT